MFVRWQNYRSVASWRPDKPIKRIKAVLVESVRVDGKPRQKYIAFLSSYNPDRSGSGRFRFWREARACLDRLDNRITPDDRIKIEAELARRVPRTTPEEIEAQERESAESWQRLKELAALRRR
jgi:hypothetical protein